MAFGVYDLGFRVGTLGTLRLLQQAPILRDVQFFLRGSSVAARFEL